jgi:hypothetical protein
MLYVHLFSIILYNGLKISFQLIFFLLRDGRVERFEPCAPIDPRHGRGGFTSNSVSDDIKGRL